MLSESKGGCLGIGAALFLWMFVKSHPCVRGALHDICCDMLYSLENSAADDHDEDDGADDGNIGVATQTRTRTKKPSPYKVLMLNDDFTPMEFVVLVLQRFFGMNMDDATRVMLHVHQRGIGVCGVFSYEVAETKVNQVIDFARENQHPLQCTLEKA